MHMNSSSIIKDSKNITNYNKFYFQYLITQAQDATERILLMQLHEQ